jgi:PknH-like extracellular domain
VHHLGSTHVSRLLLLALPTDSARLLGTGKITSCRCVEGNVTPTSSQLSTLTSRRFSECCLATAFICLPAIYRTSPTQIEQHANIGLARPACAKKDERNSPTMQRQRRLLAVGSAAAIVLMLAACGSHTTSGSAVRAQKTGAPQGSAAAPTRQAGPPPVPPKPLPASVIHKLALQTDDVNEIVGLELDDRSEFPSPGGSAADYSDPKCAITSGINKEALGNGEFTGFRQVQNKATKDDGLEALFTQNIATFETSAKANELFHKAYNSVGQCNSTTITSKTDNTSWKILAPGSFNGDVVTFGTLQLTDKNQPLGWRCDNEVRVKNNVIVEVWLCSWANGGPSVAASVDQISARIPPADKPATPEPADFLAPNKIKSLTVGVEQVGKVVGANLGDSNTYLSPPDPKDLGDKSHCGVLDGPDANSFGINVDYTAFRQTDYREDKDNYQHVIDQQAATYVDTQTASGKFQNALKGLEGCDGTLVPTATPNLQFRLQAPTITGNSAQWSIIELTDGQPDTWRCAFNFRTQSNVVFAVKICQYGNPTDVVGQIADQMASSIPK